MSFFRGHSFKSFFYISLLVMFGLLALQAVTLSYFSYVTVDTENNGTHATFMEQLNNNIDTKIKDAEYAVKLLSDYVTTSATAEALFQQRRGTVERLNDMAGMASDLRQIQGYVSDSIELVLLTDNYLVGTLSNLPASVMHPETVTRLSFYDQVYRMQPGFHLITSAEQKNELLDYMASVSAQSAVEKYREVLQTHFDNGVTVASALYSETDQRPFLFVVLLPFGKLLQMGEELHRESFVVVSGDNRIVYDPFHILGDSDNFDVLDQIPAQPSASFTAAIDGTSYQIYSVRNSYTDLTLLSFVPSASFNNDLYRIWVRIFLLLVVSTACAGLLMSLFWTSTVITPVKKLIQAIRRNSIGILQPRFRRRHGPKVNLSIKHKFMISYGLGFILISYLLTYVCYNETRYAIERNRFTLYEMIADNTAVNMDLLFTNYKNLSKFIALDRNVQQAAAGEQPVAPALTYSITDTLLSNPFNLSGLNNVVVYGIEGQAKYSLIEGFPRSGGRNLSELIPNFRELNMYGYLYWSDTSRYSLNNNKFSVVREIRDFNLDTSYRKIGYINIEINELIFNGIFNHLKRFNYETLIVDPNDHIISAGDKNYIGQTVTVYRESLARDNLEIVKSLKTNDWKMVFLVPRRDIANHVKSNLIFNLYISLAFMLVIGLFLYMFYNRLVYPLLSLNDLIKGIHSGQPMKQRYQIRGGSYDEVKELGENFNLLMERINKLIRENYVIRLQESQLETRKKEVELDALQSQINPHFIYNTLDTINWMIMLNRPQEAVAMVNNFSRLLRLSINKGDIVVQVLEELQHVMAYMDIQLQRYRDRLHFIVDVDKELWRYKTLKLILQPIVENAVYHGTENKEGLLTVVLKGYMENGKRIIFKIIDDGGGIHREQARKLNQFADSSNKRGIGLRNVYERIQLYCGPEYSISIHSVYGAGTTVLLSLPLLKGDD